MCKVTPREVIERTFVAAYRKRLAEEEAARKAKAEADAAERAKTAPKGQPKTEGRNGRRHRPDNRVKRCRAFLAKIAPSVEGQHGSDRVYQAARIVWNDFGVDGEEGYALLQEFNLRSDPPWPEDGTQGLRRKWEEAVAKGPGAEGRGYKLEQDRPGWNRSQQGASVRMGSQGGAGGPSDSPLVESNGLPNIVHTNRQYREVEADALAALIAANDPPTVFVGNGCGLADLQRGDPEAPITARELEPPAMRNVFARVANWFKHVGEEREEVDDFPPPALLSSFTQRGAWPGVPFLRSVVTYPVFGPGWVLNSEQGYHPTSQLYCDLGPLVVPPVAAAPSLEEVTEARDLILTEMLGDFPFVDQASRANAVAMLVLPLIRHAINGPTPLAVVDAPTEGTGKSLLAEVVTLATVGEIPEAVSPDVPEEEWNKLLLAMLIEGQPVVYLDNANKKLDSGAFASALTSATKRGRVLGETKIARARVNVCWILTANNFECSREIARRVYWTRIDRGVENPSAHTGYRHADLPAWVRENRPRIIVALITLVNNWLAKGRPPGSVTLGKFEAWGAAVGGILETAGIDGLLSNADEFRKTATSQAAEMPEFLGKWYERFSSTKVIANDLFEIADTVLESVLNAKDERGRRAQLGKFLRNQRDKVYGEYRIKFPTKPDGKTEDRDYASRPRYYLQPVKTKKPNAPPAGAPDEYTEGDDLFEMTG